MSKIIIIIYYLSSDDEQPASQERDFPVIKRFDDIYDTDSISTSSSKSTSSISKDGNKHVLFDVERPRVKRKQPRPTSWNPEPSLRQRRRQETADGKGGNLDGDLGYDKRLGSVSEELVQK